MAARKTPVPLNARQLAFVREYTVNQNATQAAIRAGYSAKTAHAISHKLLRNAEIRQAIERHQAAAAERTDAKLDELLRESLRIAYLDPADLFDAGGNLLPIHQMPVRARRAIAGVEVVIKNAKAGDGVTDTVHKIRFVDKTRGLELAGRYSGLLVERKETGKPGDFSRMTLDEKRAEARKLAERILQKDREP